MFFPQHLRIRQYFEKKYAAMVINKYKNSSGDKDGTWQEKVNLVTEDKFPLLSVNYYVKKTLILIEISINERGVWQ